MLPTPQSHLRTSGQRRHRVAVAALATLAMAAAPNGHLLVSNNDAINPDPNQPSEIVEFTLAGKFVTQHSMDPNFGGAFGLSASASRSSSAASRFAAVDDNQSTLLIWTLPNH